MWAVLTDFARYPEWNPFLPRIDGRAHVGARLTVLMGDQTRRGFDRMNAAMKKMAEAA